MTFTAYTETGSTPKLSFRLDVGALGCHFVSATSMATTSPALGTARRIQGLRMRGCKVKERTAPELATLEASAFRPEIVDSGNLATSFLGLVGNPTATSWLSADLSNSATSISVLSTSGFASSGYLWIDSECISYTGTSGGNTFTGCTRGVFNTLAQYHYTADGAARPYPAVTNQPITLEGQRVRLYAYGETDDLSGAGTLVYTGVVGSDPRFDGLAWSLGVESLAKVLAQKLGNPSAMAAVPRGIYYPAVTPWKALFTLGSSPEVSVEVSFPSATTDTSFFETQETFCAYVNTKIAASAMNAWDTQVRCVSDGSTGYHFEVKTGASAYSVRCTILAPASTERGRLIDNVLPAHTVDGALVTTWATSTTYILPTERGTGQVPRGYYLGGRSGSAGSSPSTSTIAAAHPDRRIYFAGPAAVPTQATMASIAWSDDEVENLYELEATTASSFFDASPSTSDPNQVRGFNGAIPITFGTHHGVGGAQDFINQLISDAPANLNLGASPDIRTGDFYDLSVLALAASGGPGFLTDRQFPACIKHTVGDVLSAELQIAGRFLALHSDGRITFPALDLPLPSPSATALTVLGKVLPQYERQSRGTVTSLVLRYRYQSASDDWRGPDIRDIDRASQGRTPHGREVEIARLSTSQYGELTSAPLPIAEVTSVASRVFAFLGDSYAEITVEVPLTMWSITVGSIVTISSANVPGFDGTMGISDRPALVIGREWHIAAGKIALALYVSGQNVAGYAPSAEITAADPAGGNIWDLTLDSGEVPSGAVVTDFFVAGDRVRVWKFDSTTSGVVEGSVVDVFAPSTVQVEFDDPYVPGSDVWILEYVGASGWSTSPGYLFIATSAGRIGFGTPAPAFVFGP